MIGTLLSPPSPKVVFMTIASATKFNIITLDALETDCMSFYILLEEAQILFAGLIYVPVNSKICQMFGNRNVDPNA